MELLGELGNFFYFKVEVSVLGLRACVALQGIVHIHFKEHLRWVSPLLQRQVRENKVSQAPILQALYLPELDRTRKLIER